MKHYVKYANLYGVKLKQTSIYVHMLGLHCFSDFKGIIKPKITPHAFDVKSQSPK